MGILVEGLLSDMLNTINDALDDDPSKSEMIEALDAYEALLKYVYPNEFKEIMRELDYKEIRKDYISRAI